MGSFLVRRPELFNYIENRRHLEYKLWDIAFYGGTLVDNEALIKVPNINIYAMERNTSFARQSQIENKDEIPLGNRSRVSQENWEFINTLAKL